MPAAPTISVVPQRADLVLYAGDGTQLRLTAKDDTTSDPVDLTGAILAQIKRNRIDTTPLTTFAVDTTQADQGILELTLTGAQTSGLLNTSDRFRGVWDIQWTAPGGEPRTLAQGNITASLDVTRSP